jgi:outer membrane protein assembly factor BamB
MPLRASSPTLFTLYFAGLLVPSFLAQQAAYAQLLLRTGRLTPAQVETIDGATRAHFERADQFLSQERWSEAVDALRRGLEGEPGRFAPLASPTGAEERDDDFVTFVPARQAAQLRLIGWKRRAPEALAHYRIFTGALADDWLARGKAERDPAPLRRIVDQAYASRATEDALRLLGEMALAQGQHQAARRYFEQLHPALTVTSTAARELQIPSGISWWHVLRKLPLEHLWERFEPWLRGEADDSPGRLSCPDPQAPLSDAWARLVLVSILEGSLERAKLELEILRRLAPEAEGELAGRRGTWTALLEHLLKDGAAWPEPKTARDWPTFAGDAERNATANAPAAAPTLGLRSVWSYPLPKLQGDKDLLAVGRARVAEDVTSLLSYHPAVIGQTVLLRSDAVGKSFVTALDLRTGEVKWRVDFPRGGGMEPTLGDDRDRPGTEVNDVHAAFLRQLGVARYTVEVSSGQAFVRLGSPVALAASRKLARLLAKDQGFLIGFDLQTQGKPLEGFPIFPESAAWGFEGTPIVRDGDLYVLSSLREGTNATSYLACYELSTTPRAVPADADARPTGKLRWRTKLGTSESLGEGEIDDLSYNLLALHEDTLYANTNRGLVAAVDRRSGEAKWLTRYPRAPFDAADDDNADSTFLRDLNPCLIYRDLCVVAPADCAQVFALHTGTGKLVWALPSGVAADAMHILGVCGDYLVLSGDYLYFVDVWTGRLITQFPAPVITGTPKPPPKPQGYGRGLVTKSHVFWPTRDQLFIFEGRVEKHGPRFEPKLAKVVDLAPRGLSGGNLVLAGDTLLIATGDKLVAVKVE